MLLWQQNRLEQHGTWFHKAIPGIACGVLVAGNSYHIISKSFCGEISCLSKHLIKFSRTPEETAKAIATYKETTNNKIPQTADAIGSIQITILDLSTDPKIDYYNRK